MSAWRRRSHSQTVGLDSRQRGSLSLCVPKIDQALLNLSMSRLELKPISVQVVNLSKQLSRLSGFRA